MKTGGGRKKTEIRRKIGGITAFFKRKKKGKAKDSDKFAKKNEKTTAKDLIFFTFYITIIFG